MNMNESGALSPQRCRLCTCRLQPAEGDDLQQRVCASCKTRPEARRLGTAPADTGIAAPARDFTPAERALVARMHQLMPADQLLALLNERLRCDLGPDARPYTHEQLEQVLGTAGPACAGPQDWAGLRRVLSRARRDGVLAQVTAQAINDFAVIFQLNAKQALTLREVLANQEDDDD